MNGCCKNRQRLIGFLSSSSLVYIVPLGVKAAWLSDSLIVGNWNGSPHKLDVSEIVSSS